MPGRRVERVAVVTYQPVQSWELRRHRGARKGAEALKNVILVLFHGHGVRNGGIYVRRRQRGGSAWSLHAVGRAVDFMVPNKPIGDLLAGVLTARAEGLGVGEVIWYRRRWTTERGWQPYRGVNGHLDHVHVGLELDVADSAATLENLQRWFAGVLTAQ